MKKYIVYWTGGERDGEIILTCNDENTAVKFAKKFWNEHESEFDPVCGGVSVEDENRNIVW